MPDFCKLLLLEFLFTMRGKQNKNNGKRQGRKYNNGTRKVKQYFISDFQVK
jgi:hypothetical protein